jgi:hypothetical protein
MNYYKKQDKEKRREIKKNFLDSNESLVYKKSSKIIVVSFIGIAISVLASVFDCLYKTGLFNYILDGLLFVFSLIFLIKMFMLRADEINKFALAGKKKGKK